MDKHRLTALTVSAFLPLLSVHADQSDMDSSKSQMKSDRPQVVNPSGRPQVKGGANLFITVDYLIWQATEQNLNYAANIVSGVSAQGDVFSARFDWKSGCRLGLGYNIGHDQWDTNITWTWLYDHGHSHAKATTDFPALFATVTSPAFVVSSTKASSDIGLHLNMLDWELGREFYSSKWMTLRPFAGIRTGWVHQSWTSTYTEGATLGATAIEQFQVVLKQKFWGMGLRGGLDTEWGLISGLSFYANGALSLLYGFYHDARLEDHLTLAGIPIIDLNGVNSKRCEQAITELQMGLRWDQMFSCDRFHFRIQAGWEHMVFFDHNRQFTYIEAGTSSMSEYGGNLGFQGWSISTRLDF